jgi:hypothetical protein
MKEYNLTHHFLKPKLIANVIIFHQIIKNRPEALAPERVRIDWKQSVPIWRLAAFQNIHHLPREDFKNVPKPFCRRPLL